MKARGVWIFEMLIFSLTLVLFCTDVTGSFVAVLAMAVLYECAIGLHVRLRSHILHRDREKRLTKKTSDFDYTCIR